MSFAQLEQYASDSSDDESQGEGMACGKHGELITPDQAIQREHRQYSRTDIEIGVKALPANLNRDSTNSSPLKPTVSNATTAASEPSATPAPDGPRPTHAGIDTSLLQPSFRSPGITPNTTTDNSESHYKGPSYNASNLNSVANCKKAMGKTAREIRQKKREAQVLPQNSTNLSSELPAELLEELRRQGNGTTPISFVDVNARALISEDRAAIASHSERSQNAHASPVPSHVVHKTAERIAKGRGVSRLERRRHQITALAADAAALAAVKQTFPATGGHQSSGAPHRR